MCYIESVFEKNTARAERMSPAGDEKEVLIYAGIYE